MLELWIARDKNGYLYGYDEIPQKKEKYGFFVTANISSKQYNLDSRLFSEVTWDNSPRKVKIELI